MKKIENAIRTELPLPEMNIKNILIYKYLIEMQPFFILFEERIFN